MMKGGRVMTLGDDVSEPGELSWEQVDLDLGSSEWNTTLKQSHQNLIGLRLICNISAWIFIVEIDFDVSRTFVDIMCFYPSMWTFCSAEIPPHHHRFFWTGRSNQMFSIQLWCFELMLQQRPPTPPLLLLFLSSIHSCLPSVSAGFIYRLRHCRGDGGRDGKNMSTVLLFPLRFTHFSFLLTVLLPQVFLSSSLSRF